MKRRRKFAWALTFVGLVFGLYVLGCGGSGGSRPGTPGAAVFVGTFNYLVHFGDISKVDEYEVRVDADPGHQLDSIINDIDIDKQGRVVMAVGDVNHICRLDDPRNIGSMTIFPPAQGVIRHTLSKPLAVAVDGQNRIYIADTGNNRIVRMNDIDGSGWVALGSVGSGVEHFNNPSGITVDVAGNIYVADTGNGRIVRMNSIDGSGWATVGQPGSLPGGEHFSSPYDVSVDIAGHLFVCDRGNGRIVYMDDITGAGFKAFGSRGSASCQFIGPVRIAQDEVGRLYIADVDRMIRIDGINGSNWTESPISFGPNGHASSIGIFLTPANVDGAITASCTIGAVNYTFKDLHHDLGDPVQSSANAVNDHGDVVGQLDPPGGQPVHAFVWHLNGSFQDLGPGIANGINASGKIVGTSNTNEPVILSGGLQVLSSPGNGHGAALGVNSNGQVVGWIEKTVLINNQPETRQSAAVWSKTGDFYDLGTLIGSDNSVATAINSNGDVVGYRWTGDDTLRSVPILCRASVPNTPAFSVLDLDFGTYLGGQALCLDDTKRIGGALWDDIGNGKNGAAFWSTVAHVTALPIPDKSQIAAVTGTNNLNFRVGYFGTKIYAWSPTDFAIDLNTFFPGAQTGSGNPKATDVNNNGVVVGQWLKPGGLNDRAFALVPKP